LVFYFHQDRCLYLNFIIVFLQGFFIYSSPPVTTRNMHLFLGFLFSSEPMFIFKNTFLGSKTNVLTYIHRQIVKYKVSPYVPQAWLKTLRNISLTRPPKLWGSEKSKAQATEKISTGAAAKKKSKPSHVIWHSVQKKSKASQRSRPLPLTRLLLVSPVTLSPSQGYKNRSIFLKIIENRCNWTGPTLKTTKITVHYFKISKKIKINKIYVKKLDWILRLLVKNFL
jgi:hypothetical protein